MTKTFPEIVSHAQDISHAVFRVATLIKHAKLKTELESAAVELLTECGEVPYLPYTPKGVRLPYLPYVERLRRLIWLSETVGEMKSVNAEVLGRELDGLQSAIADSIVNGEDIDLRNIFSDRKTTIEGTKESGFDEKTRQSAIMDYIRQLPNGCRMRDLIAKFPEVSERTLRNDLRTWVARGLVERVGIQGPTSFFRVPRQSSRSLEPKLVTKGEIIAL